MLQTRDVVQNFSGRFVTEPESLLQKLTRVQAYVFDWDGVFNGGVKDTTGSSPFNEVDAMGTNLLRFAHFLRTGKLPVFIIISGENNKAAQTLAMREHFHAVYGGIKSKREALEHLCSVYDIRQSEIFFMFDDVLDLSIAALAAVRIMVQRKANPLLNLFVLEKKWVDYIPANDGDHYAVRETAELVIGLHGRFSEVAEERMAFSPKYQRYLEMRNAVAVEFYTSTEGQIVKQIQ